jgi:hypothetical protein
MLNTDSSKELANIRNLHINTESDSISKNEFINNKEKEMHPSSASKFQTNSGLRH